jgi:integrase
MPIVCFSLQPAGSLDEGQRSSCVQTPCCIGIASLLQSPGGPRERIVTYLLVYIAARSGELRDLRWGDVDLVNGLAWCSECQTMRVLSYIAQRVDAVHNNAV